MQNNVSIFNQRYRVEVYKPKPRIIKCNKCQRFGHVERICREDKPVCGKCTSRNHETKDCVVESENYKCHHCDGNHITGNNECEVMKEKMEERKNQR